MIQAKPATVVKSPSGRKWAVVIVTSLIWIGIAYGCYCYGLLHEAREKFEDSPASRLLALQRGALVAPRAPSADAAPRRLGIDGDNVDDYISNYERGRAPTVLVCAGSCGAASPRVRLRLAYGLHHDLELGADAWDFWFAPVENGHWVKDPLRLLYRVNPGQGNHWGLVLGDVTDLDVDFSDHKIAGLHDFGATTTADFLDRVVKEQRIEAVNFVGAPAASLTEHTGFLERNSSPLRPPYWKRVGAFTERTGHSIGAFVARAIGEMTPKDWLIASLSIITLVGSLLTLSVAIALAWWAVLRYEWQKLIDWFRREMQRAQEDGEPVLWDRIRKKEFQGGRRDSAAKIVRGA
jgi:hypothetical protein